MSTPARIARGTGLTLATVATNILGQVATVPIFLSHWHASTYGVWLIMIGAFSYLFLLSGAFQQYAYGEMLKAGAGARDAVRGIWRISVVMAFFVAAVELMIVAVLTSHRFLAWVAPDLYGTPLVEAVAFFLLLYSALNFLTMPLNAITAHANTVHGHYPRVAFWALVNAVFRLVAPAIAVLAGAGFKTAVLVYVLAHVASILPALWDMLRLARREGLLQPTSLDWRQGVRNVVFSLPLAARTLIDSFRQQGFRLILGAFIGPVAVSVLATTRTFANVLHQGLTTITAPVLPELMRYITARDQDRIEGAFAIVWLCLFALLVPSMLILCLLAESVFLFWTRGAVTFDPVLFLSLVMAVIVFAAAQPAVAVLQGQNRVGWLIGAAVAATAGLGALALALMPLLGLRGAGAALLGAEVCALAVALGGATRVLVQGGLAFPRRSFALVLANVAVVGGLTLAAVSVFDSRVLAFMVPLATNLVFAALYWATIPALARARIRDVLDTLSARLPDLRQTFKAR
ncbi:hypothetical protein MAA5396_04722 [Marinovum algicola]|uniref:Membrane protein involved in the export of O-antigen and teichoic acid n=1 Tax=Marinovum algicola TaxID=42444 RepID=A0A975WFL2_9RHOB|nr:hypothetical protein [Marinovum algicola]SEK11261.1 Membrane protein involved in the export of O-antigen and teichoic acid [Marinovum algicola]SLN76442.1 hypothetical protein MAA5396_04722 [Marinovum algicola]